MEISEERLKELIQESDELRSEGDEFARAAYSDMHTALTQLLAYRESGALARSIADALFTNGAGEKAERLVLELADKRDGGGWCRKAVEDVIKRELEAIEK